MWAVQLFKAFRDGDNTKEKELTKYLDVSSKATIHRVKSLYKMRKKQGMTPFIAAILYRDTALCVSLIDGGMNFSQQCSVGALDAAKFVKFVNSASELIYSGPSSNAFNDFKMTTPMFWAIGCGQLCLIDKLLSSGHKMNAHVEKYAGMPTLSFAILCGNVTVVRHLLQNHPCDIHEDSLLQDMKPLDIAVRSGITDMVELVLKHGETPNCSNHQVSPLLRAVYMNNTLVVKLLLSMGANINFGLEAGKFFLPLNMAILHCHFETASILIEEGANVDLKDSTDNTPMHMLLPHLKIKSKDNLYQSAFKVAQLILGKGAKVDVANEKGKLPLAEAIMLNDPELVELFLSSPTDLNTLLVPFKEMVTYLHIAVSPPFMFKFINSEGLNTKDCWKKRYSIVQSLIERGADVNKQSSDENTTLHFAAASGNVEIVKLLLAHKVDVNKLGEKGKVALHYAACNGSSKVVELMLESGAKVNVKDIFGSTPLALGLIENEHFSCETTKLLIDYGADIYCGCLFKKLKIYDVLVATMMTDLIKLFWREGYPYDLTMIQPSKGFPASSVQSFFDKVAKKSIVSLDFQKRLKRDNRKQVEELMSAQKLFISGVEKNNVNLVKSAMQQGAEVRGSSIEVPFPLHFLAKRGFTDVAKFLLTQGVQPNTIDREGKTPTDLAVEFGHYKVFIILLQYGACYNRPGFNMSIGLLQKQWKYQQLELYIRKAFKLIKGGDHLILEYLNKFASLKEWNIYYALVNCVDEKGRTLMALAVERGHALIIQKLMEYRLQAPDLSSLQLV